MTFLETSTNCGQCDVLTHRGRWANGSTGIFLCYVCYDELHPEESGDEVKCRTRNQRISAAEQDRNAASADARAAMPTPAWLVTAQKKNADAQRRAQAWHTANDAGRQ